MALTKAQLIDLNGNELILDLDADTSITADTDDQIDIKIAGADDFRFTANTFTALSGSTIAAQALTATTLTTTGAIAIANDGNIGSAGDADSIAISSAGVVTFSQSPVFPDGSLAVVDLDIDGATDIGAAIVDADLLVVDDGAGGTNRKTAASRIKTYIADVTLTTAAQTAITSVGTLTTLTVDDITINGSTISDGGDFTLDVEGDIILDANGADIFLKDAGTTYGSLTNTSGNLIIKSGTTTAATFSGANVTLAGTVGSGAITSTGTVQGTTITATTAFVPDASDGAALGTSSLEFSDLFLADAAVISLGDDDDVTITHVADTGILINSTNVIQFNDASQNIGAPSNAILDINATDEIELNATLVDINANVEISGTATTTGVHTFSATPVFPDGSLALADLDIDGGTDIGAAIVDADLFIIDDGAGGTNRKVTAARIKTYAGVSGDVTTIDSLLKADIKIGEDDQTKIDFETADEIHLYAANAEQVYVADGIFGPQTDSDVDLGTTGVRWKDAYIDTITTTGASLFPTLGVVTAKDLGAGIHIRISDTGASVNASADELIIERSGDNGMTFLNSVSGESFINFGDSGDNDIGQMSYHHSSNHMAFKTNATERIRIDSAGKVGIGTTTMTKTLNVTDTTASASTGIQLIGANDGTQFLNFGDTDDTNVGEINYDHSLNKMNFRTNDAYAMVIDSAGIVTKPLQPAFHATGATQDNLGTDASATITFSTEVFDLNADFNTGNYTFTAPVTGKYHLTFHITLTNMDSASPFTYADLATSNRRYLSYYDNNVELSGDAGYVTFHTSVLADMDASDTAVAKVFIGGGTAQTDVMISQATYFTGYLAC